MKLLFHAFSLEAKNFLAYPFELIAGILTKVSALAFLIVLWKVIEGSSDSKLIDQSLIGYFLLAQGISSLTMSQDTVLGRFIRRGVKDGSISNYIVKPMNILPFIYGTSLGGNAVSFVYGIITSLIGFVLLKPQNLPSILIFCLLFICSFCIGLAMNIFEGSLSFVFTEVSGVKNAIRHVSRVFSGLIIPISLFPDTAQRIIYLTPFPYMIYKPIEILTSRTINSETWKVLLISVIWSGISLGLAIFFWRRVLKFYEAVGL